VTDVETSRLLLRLVPLAGLAATAAKDRDACRRLIGRALPDEWFEDAWVSEMRLKQWKDDPEYAPWSIRAIALKETGEIIGNINCHDKPQLFEHEGRTGSVVEMGYTIFARWRRQGYGYEAVEGLSEFAARMGVRWIRLSISPANEASLALARKLGARKIGAQVDDVDGPEDIYLFLA
jgi:[ribosomal protein S5]-alanine N-acetyltransferase